MENSEILVIKDFISADVNRELFADTAMSEALFSKSKTGDGRDYFVNENIRKSLIADAGAFEKYSSLILDTIGKRFSNICESLDMPVFSLADPEVHVTAHNHGDFFRPHTDSNASHLSSRVLTFVYYFNSIPKRYSGGQLLFLQHKPAPLIIEPENNMIVFFKSSMLHAVHPVVCETKEFKHSRFTINGWLRKKKSSTD